MLRILKREHAELETFLAEAQAYLRACDEDGDLTPLRDYRARFDRWMKRHLEFLGGTIAPALRAQGSPAAARVEQKVVGETMALWDHYAQHAKRFPIGETRPDWAAWRAASGVVSAEVLDLVALSRAELYPVLAGLELLPTAPPAKAPDAPRSH